MNDPLSPNDRQEPGWMPTPVAPHAPAAPAAPAAPREPANPNMVFCRHCGHTLHVTAPACPKCGAPQALPQAAPVGGKSKVVAGLLALLLGGLGVHRFYLGQWWGVVYLLLCWTGLPALVAIVEGIVFLCSDQKNWDARHNGGRPSSNSAAGVVAAAVIAAFVGIAVVGILAAIAIPAYQDYVTRAKAQSAHSQLLLAAPKVAEFVQSEQRIPSSLAEAGFRDAPSQGLNALSLDPNTAVLTATLLAPVGGHDESGLRLIPSRSVDGDIEWQCEAFGLREQQVPKACR